MIQKLSRKNIFSFLFQNIHPSSLAFFRIWFGLTIAGYVFIVRHPFSSGSVEQLFVQPEVFFPFSLFETLGLKHISGVGMYRLFFVMGLSGIAIAIGFCYRFSLLILFLTHSYMFLYEKSYYNNHYYLILLFTFLLFFCNANLLWSFDALRRKKNSENQGVPFWNIWILRVQICIVYFYAGITKINLDWMEGRHFRLWLFQKQDYLFLSRLYNQEWFMLFLSWSGMLFDIFIPFLLIFRKTRILAFVLIAFFHLVNQWLFHISIFHFLMIGTIVLFVDPDQPDRWFKSIKQWLGVPVAYQEDVAQDKHQLQNHPKNINRAIIGFLSIFLLIQMVVPLKRFTIKDDFRWRHDGYRFGWHLVGYNADADILIKITDKRNRFLWTLVADSSETIINQEIYDSDLAQELATHPLPTVSGVSDRQMFAIRLIPDTLFDYLQYWKKVFSERGITDLVIKVNIFKTINGRIPSKFIDTNVNFAEMEYPLFSQADWVLPHPDVQAGRRLPFLPFADGTN